VTGRAVVLDPGHPLAVPTEAAHLRRKIRGPPVLREGCTCPNAGCIVAAEYAAPLLSVAKVTSSSAETAKSRRRPSGNRSSKT
jgi:hypothetical protein